jgi:hypothetical protein
MSNKREKDLWKELDKLAFWASALAIAVFAASYFIIAGTAPSEDSFWAIVRTFALDIIANLIPTFLLFAGSYALLRRIQILKAQRETEDLSEELASKVATRVVQTLADSVSRDASSSDWGMPRKPLSEDDKFRLMVSGEFEITKKYFDAESTPQKIVIQFTNRGNNVIHIEKVKFSATMDLKDTALLTSYRKEEGGRYIIVPFDNSKAEVLPGQDFVVEMHLAQRWESDAMSGLAGRWGYLKPDVTYSGQSVQLFYPI